MDDFEDEEDEDFDFPDEDYEESDDDEESEEDDEFRSPDEDLDDFEDEDDEDDIPRNQHSSDLGEFDGRPQNNINTNGLNRNTSGINSSPSPIVNKESSSDKLANSLVKVLKVPGATKSFFGRFIISDDDTED